MPDDGGGHAGVPEALDDGHRTSNHELESFGRLELHPRVRILAKADATHRLAADDVKGLVGRLTRGMDGPGAGRVRDGVMAEGKQAACDHL